MGQDSDEIVTAPSDAGWTGFGDDRVRVGAEFRTVVMVAERELIRFVRARGQLVTGFIQPLSFLLILGVGLNRLVTPSGDVNFVQFVLPGVVAMSVVGAALLSGASVVIDREFGFMREMVVAPPHRTSLVAGKIIGGTLVSTIKGVVVLVLAPLLGITLDVVIVVAAAGIAMLIAMAVTALGVFLACWIQRLETFQAVMQMLLMPMMFLSGALFPIRDLPGWLAVLTHVNPLTYGVDSLRRVVLSREATDLDAQGRFATGVELFGYELPVIVELAVVVGLGLLFAAMTIRRFGKPQ
ncbi:ABC transporter permease [Haloechinothrix salitolerans]|uniref:Transport permease protein n=1 Tax=Haloechinothrix salitolerans TaxID=926830 RepID=A0ABW2BUM7_9PSEU